MVLKDLKEGKFVIENGVVSILTPLTTTEAIEKEMMKESEKTLKVEQSEELLAREMGKAIEFLTANNWKISFLKDKQLLIGAPFEGGVMKGKKGKEYKYYIPKGYLIMRFYYDKFPSLNGKVFVLPNLKNKSLREIFEKSKIRGMFFRVHPHCLSDDGSLCAGISTPYKFDIDKIISLIKACIYGSKKKEGTSIWDYNPHGEITEITKCVKGKKAYELYKKGHSDDEIWTKI